VGRVAGHRGAAGEITVRVVGGDASSWAGLGRAWLEREDGAGRWYRVERSRAYRDRLVLKLEGIDGPSEAEALRGSRVSGAESDCRLPEGKLHPAVLVGLEVRDVTGRVLGTVEGVLPTGGTDVLVVSRGGGSELLVPLAPEVVRSVDRAGQRITVELPEGLEELNDRC
jgi:16S rRNA processing protein RimM